MSKFVDEILTRIEEKPNDWRHHSGGIEIPDKSIVIDMYGNTALLSIIDVEVNGCRVQTTWRDRYRLEKALTKWATVVDLETLLKH